MKVPASLLQRSCTYKPYWLTDIVPRTALAVLWLAMHRFDVDSMVALTLAEAAGVSGRQNWSLILSSSARVSRVTYEAVIAVRYPELDHTLAQEVQFGTYLAEGFFPSFGFPPMIPFVRPLILGQRLIGSPGQLELEAGENGCLAVLHNRNDMVGAFNGSEWVSSSKGRVVSRGVTSCAGMTAHHVLLTQTKVGFLTGGRGRNFHKLADAEKNAPARGGLCSSDSGPYKGATFLFPDVSFGHERPGWSCYCGR